MDGFIQIESDTTSTDNVDDTQNQTTKSTYIVRGIGHVLGQIPPLLNTAAYATTLNTMNNFSKSMSMEDIDIFLSAAKIPAFCAIMQGVETASTHHVYDYFKRLGHGNAGTGLLKTLAINGATIGAVAGMELGGLALIFKYSYLLPESERAQQVIMALLGVFLSSPVIGMRDYCMYKTCNAIGYAIGNRINPMTTEELGEYSPNELQQFMQFHKDFFWNSMSTEAMRVLLSGRIGANDLRAEAALYASYKLITQSLQASSNALIQYKKTPPEDNTSDLTSSTLVIKPDRKIAINLTNLVIAGSAFLSYELLCALTAGVGRPICEPNSTVERISMYLAIESMINLTEKATPKIINKLSQCYATMFKSNNRQDEVANTLSMPRPS